MDGVFSYQTYIDLKKKVDSMGANLASNPIRAPERTFLGLSVVPSGVFPMENTCGSCNGTGQGQASTYCEKCSGAGKRRFDGMMKNGAQTILLETKLPKAFSPSFPKGILAKPPISRGLK